jgi:mycothiol synthase
MVINLRPYQADDRAAMLHFAGICNAADVNKTHIHPGDVLHVMINAHRGAPPERFFYLYEENGVLLALVMLYPLRYKLYGLLMHPARRGGDLEAALIAWTEARLIEQAKSEEIVLDCIITDVAATDPIRAGLLQNQEYKLDDAYFAYTTRPLDDAVPTPGLPDGFVIRSAMLDDAEALGVLHSAAFNSKWQPGQYAAVMQTPGFDPERELVVVAPDGQLAAFLVYWLDPVSKSGLFEPVGCHPDFQKRGLTKALMLAGLERMRAAGMTSAIVKHELKNEASTALYASVGFKQVTLLSDYQKNVSGS